MDYKQLISQIREAAGAEVQPKIDGFLKQLESGFNDLSDDLKSANTESKDRKLKLRELTAQFEDVSAKLKESEGKANDPKVAEELTALRAFKTESLKKQKESFVAEFGKIEKHPAFEKAKDIFKLPKPDKDGKIDLTKIEDADLEYNVAELAKLNKLGLFADAQPPANPFNLPRTTGNPNQPAVTSRDTLMQVQRDALKNLQ